MKVSPDPVMLKHYKDGDFHKDYDRQMTVPSFVNFLRDPSGDLPWDEDETGADVVHIGDTEVSQIASTFSPTLTITTSIHIPFPSEKSHWSNC